MAEYVKKSAIRDAVSSNVGSDVYEAVDEAVEDMIMDAEERAKANGRKTVKSRDV